MTSARAFRRQPGRFGSASLRLCASGLLLLPALASASARAPRGPSEAFVQLFEWSWEDVALECEQWLGPKGFTAVQVSPPNEHAAGPEWHVRYKPVSYRLISRSGDEAQFAAMVRRCEAAGVGVYVDAVFNHMAGPWGGVGVAGTPYADRAYPMYSPRDFHHSQGTEATNCGVSNYDDKYNVQFCDLEGMPDLCTGCPYVQNTVAGFINRMAEIGIAGFRVDAAKNQDPKELGELLSKVNSSLFRFQEVPFGGVVKAEMYAKNGRVTEFGYAGTLAPKFAAPGSLHADLAEVGEDWGLIPSGDAVVFLDNHDTQRDGSAPLTVASGPVYILASAFMLAHPYGYPRIMSSYVWSDKNQGPPAVPVHGPAGVVRCGPGQPWVCEHRHPGLANMPAWRRAAGDAAISTFYADRGGSMLAFCRGDRACIAINRGDAPGSVQLQTELPPGEYCDVFKSMGPTCTSLEVVKNKKTVIQVPAFGAVAFHVDALKTPSAASAASAASAQPALRGRA